ncbi:hypothetical protein JL720_10166 [Aureococcus anophagefferens]|nr:hypothetical protein JL720_10166 [Aureococcus anophagefferens]
MAAAAPPPRGPWSGLERERAESVKNFVEQTKTSKKRTSIAFHKSDDPLDAVLAKVKNAEASGELDREGVLRVMQQLLGRRLKSLQEIGRVVTHTFRGEELGLKISLARYGAGREYVEVDEIFEESEVADMVRKGDELIAINKRLILEPTQETFPLLIKSIATAGRPISFTFIKGERHEESVIDSLVASAEGYWARAKACREEIESHREKGTDSVEVVRGLVDQARVAHAIFVAREETAVLADKAAKELKACEALAATEGRGFAARADDGAMLTRESLAAADAVGALVVLQPHKGLKPRSPGSQRKFALKDRYLLLLPTETHYDERSSRPCPRSSSSTCCRSSRRRPLVREISTHAPQASGVSTAGCFEREDFLNLALDKAETKVLRSPDDDGDGKADGVTDLLALESVSCDAGGNLVLKGKLDSVALGPPEGVAVDLAALAKHLNDRIAFYAELEARAADPDGYEAAKLLHDVDADCEGFSVAARRPLFADYALGESRGVSRAWSAGVVKRKGTSEPLGVVVEVPVRGTTPSVKVAFQGEAELWVGPVSELELEEGRGAAPPPPSASPKKAARRASYGHVDWAAPGAQADAHKLRDRAVHRALLRPRRLAELDPVLVNGLMGDLKVNDLPEIDDALYLKHEHEYKPSEEEPFDDKYPQHCWSCDPVPNENNEDYEFYLCGTTVSLEMSPSLQPPPPPIETVEREGIVDGITYRNESLFNPEFPYTRGFIEAVTT